MSIAFWLIVTLTIQVSLLAILALVAQRLALRSRPRESSRLLALSSLLMLLLSVAILLPLPSWFSAEGNQESDAAANLVVEDNSLAMESLFDTDAIESDSAQLGLPAITLAERIRSLSKQIDEPVTQDQASGIAWLASSVRTIAVAIGVLLVIGLIQFLLGLVALWRLKSKSLKVTSIAVVNLTKSLCEKIGCERHIEIYRCPDLATAATVGTFSPHIFIADDFEAWDLESQRSVLAHEIAHIHHRDFEANVLSQLCRVVHFFNPAVHFLAKQLRLQQELAADRVAAEATIGAIPYSRCLLYTSPSPRDRTRSRMPSSA